MCGMPECTVEPVRQWVSTSIQGAKTVLRTWCPSCDTRRCPNPKCARNVPQPKADRCPVGHRL